jgi:Domain of unknown function (DUF4365)
MFTLSRHRPGILVASHHVDIQIAAGGAMRPKIDLQLKASIRLSGSSDDVFFYPLKVKNYNDLRIATQTPRLLLVLDLPRASDERLAVSVDELIIRRAAYWVSLRGMPNTTNSTSVTIHIPKANIFNVRALSKLMDQSRQGRIT